MAEVSKLFLRGHLQIEIDGRYQILTWLGQDSFDLILNSAATIHYHFPITVPAAQILIISLFKSALSDHISGLGFSL